MFNSNADIFFSQDAGTDVMGGKLVKDNGYTLNKWFIYQGIGGEKSHVGVC